MTEAVVTVTEQLNIPIKDIFTTDAAGSIALGSANRIKTKGSDNIVREIANLEETIPLSQKDAPSGVPALDEHGKLDQRYLKSITSIAQLKTIPGLSEADRVFVSGYYVSGDRGAGEFRWSATSTDNDNEGTVIQVTGVSTGRWVRIFDGMHRPAYFGVMGNGTDEGAKLQAIISLGRDMIFEGSRREYRTKQTLVLSRPRQVLNFNGSELLAANDSNFETAPGSGIYHPLIRIDGEFCRIDNIVITGSATNKSGGIQVNGLRSAVEHFYIGGVIQGHGINLTALEATLRFGRIRGALGNGVNVTNYDVNIMDVFSEHNGSSGFATSNHGSMVLYNCHALLNRIGFYIGGAGFCQISSCYADTNSYLGWHILNSSSNKFVDCWGFQSGSGENGQDILEQGTSTNNMFIACSTSKNASIDPTTPDWIMTNTSTYLGCSSLRTPAGYSTAKTIIGCYGALAQYNQVKGINTGDETVLTVAAKLDLRQTWTKSALDVPVINGLYTIAIPELLNRRPTRVTKDSIPFRPIAIENITSGQVYYDSIAGTLSFLTPVLSGDIFEIDSIPMIITESPQVADKFERTAATLDGSIATDGQIESTWAVTSSDGLGVWSISASRAKATAGANTTLLLTEGTANGYIEATATLVKTSGTVNDRYMAIAFRTLDLANTFFLSYTNTAYWTLRKSINGVGSTLAIINSVPATSGDFIKIAFNGNKILVYINGVLQASVIDNDLITNTKFGFAGRGNTDSSSAWGDISFYDTSAGAV
ncbi:hypothetical protein ACSBL2_24645 [Pedobacter sp. AW31-3R]|uniref:hypothetical protein n=1 Tax=Pedobacter sp. AW31-3R TaxID=3445781 RepID=UPI003FA17CD8